MLILLRLRSGRRRILSECQSQDSQHLNSSSSQHSTIIIMDSQADKTVARSISHHSLRYTATTTISLFFRFSIAPFITAILVVRARASLPSHSRGPAAEQGARRFAPPLRIGMPRTTPTRSRGKPGPPLPLPPPRPATCSVSFALSNLHGFLRARPVEG